MNLKNNFHPVYRLCTGRLILTFTLLIVMVSVAACNLPLSQPEEIVQEFSDKNARMYQMYFDTSADPAQNELQTRRFIGHLHLSDIETIFGDIQSLPMDENCNYVGGPVLDDEGTSWYATITPDLVGVNLISITPDGTRSSAFDLDGDRVVDILDMRFSDNRRISFVTELMGLEVFREWLQGRDPFCNTEVARQLGLPDLGCNGRSNGSSGGGSGNFAGSGIIDPIDMLCSEYDTGPMSDFMARNPNQALYTERTVKQDVSAGGIISTQETTDRFDGGPLGEFVGTDRTTTYVDIDNPNALSIIIEEHVTSDGYGTRQTTVFHTDGTSSTTTEGFTVAAEDVGRPNYNSNRTQPPPSAPAPTTTTYPESNNGQEGGETDNCVNTPGCVVTLPGEDGHPGPEGSDMIVSEICRNRANHRSGIEQATEQDPTSISVSCGDLVGAPSNGHCNIIEWARPEDFNGVLTPPSADGGCAFEDPDRRCEGESIEDQIRRFIGLNAELWSLDLPENNLCPPFLCDPAQSVELQTYTAGGIEFSCPVTTEATLEPSEENCPPGTYFAPVTNRCIAIEVHPGGGESEGGEGGSCGLSAPVCSGQGQSFDQNTCECVDIQ